MPSGTRHELTGELLRTSDSFELLVDDGGRRWLLTLPYEAERLVGRRIAVIGCRDERGRLFVQDFKAL
jgi:hypothetical protein